MRNPVGWFEIYVSDIDRAKKFYEQTFGIKLEKLPPLKNNETNPEFDPSKFEMWTFPMEMNAGGAGGAIVKMDGFKPGGNSVLVYFSCDDCGVTEKNVEPAGGRIEKPKMPIGEHGFISIVYDSEGNMIGLHSMK
jgi:uncharacterized protein